MKKTNVILMLAFTALVCSLMGCSQEDDGYDNAEMYTLAEMGTRLGGEGGRFWWETSQESDSLGKRKREHPSTYKPSESYQHIESFLFA